MRQLDITFFRLNGIVGSTSEGVGLVYNRGNGNRSHVGGPAPRVDWSFKTTSMNWKILMPESGNVQALCRLAPHVPWLSAGFNFFISLLMYFIFIAEQNKNTAVHGPNYMWLSEFNYYFYIYYVVKRFLHFGISILVRLRLVKVIMS